TSARLTKPESFFSSSTTRRRMTGSIARGARGCVIIWDTYDSPGETLSAVAVDSRRDSRRRADGGRRADPGPEPARPARSRFGSDGAGVDRDHGPDRAGSRLDARPSRDALAPPVPSDLAAPFRAVAAAPGADRGRGGRRGVARPDR